MARNRKLGQFGRKSERTQRSRKGGTEREARRRRGRQPGSPSHGRTPREDLPVEVEVIEPGECRCLRQALREKRRKGHRVRRGRGPRLQAALPSATVPFNMFVCTEAGGGRSAGTAAVREHGPERLELVSDRDLRPSSSVAVGTATVVDARLRGRAGHAGGQRQALRSLVRTTGRRNCRAQRLAHGDETSWRIHARGEEGENPRSWLWVCQTPDAVRMIVDPSRSAAAAQKLFGGLGVDEPVYLVCDRYSAYKKLVRELPNHFVLAYCWVHVRRDFVNIGLGRPDMKPFGDWWVNRIGELCGRNAKRLQHWDSTANEQTAAFDEAQQELENDIETFAGTAASLDAPQRKPLQSLLRHREGLEVYDQPCQWTTTLPNGPCAVPRRKLSFGSFSETGAQLAGLLFSVHIGVSWSLAAPSRLFAGLRRTQRTAARGCACLASLGCGPCPHLARRGSAGAMSYCGRAEDELDPEQRNGIPLSNALPCRASCANAWRKPNGGLRVPASPCCAWNVTALSFCRHAGPPASFARSRPETEPPLFPVPDRQVRPLRIEPIRSTKEGKLWNAGHYLGFTPMPGAQHFVRSAEGEPLAVLGFGAAAWKTAPRDKFIGWERRQRTFRRQQREVTALGQNQTYPMSSHR